MPVWLAWVGLWTAAGALSGCGSLWLWRVEPVREAPAVAIAMGDQDVPHVSVFYDALAGYGTWVVDADYGWVWEPGEAGYMPYTRGTWVATEAGPTWLGDEPFAWAVDHYGHWEWRGTAAEGRWRWVPGTVWGPAWVEWRVGDGVVGWAPLAAGDGPEGSPPAEAWQFVANEDFWAREVGTRVYGQAYAGYFLIRSHPHIQWAERAPMTRRMTSVPGRFPTGPALAARGPFGMRMRLSNLPASRIRWVPAWARPTSAAPRPSIRAAPAFAKRYDRAGPARASTPHAHRHRH